MVDSKRLGNAQKWFSIVSSGLNICVVAFIAIVIIWNWSDINKFSLGFLTIEKVTARARKAADEINDIKLKAKETQRKNDEFLQFLKTASAASFGDKRSFDRLKTWAKEDKYTFHSQAKKAYSVILLEHNYDSLALNMGPPLNKKLDIKIDNFNEAVMEYDKVEETLKPKVIYLVWKNKKWSKYDKMRFFIYALKKTDGDLGAFEVAGKYFTQMSGLEVPRLDIEPMLEWWEKNKASIKSK